MMGKRFVSEEEGHVRICRSIVRFSVGSFSESSDKIMTSAGMADALTAQAP